MPDILAGKIEPGRVFHQTIGLDKVPDRCLRSAQNAGSKIGLRQGNFEPYARWQQCHASSKMGIRMEIDRTKPSCGLQFAFSA